MSIIKNETFIANETQPEHGFWIDGTVEVTLGKETRRVKAFIKGNVVTAFGMTGRYATGTKAWAASVAQRIDPTTGKVWDSVNFGRDDRSAKFCKVNGLSFA